MLFESRSVVAIFFACILLCGCLGQTHKESEALIENHNGESIAELSQLISEALGKPTTITELAFTSSNRIAIEASKQFDIRYGEIIGNQRQKPPIFALTIRNGQCFLTHQNTGARWSLEKVSCVPRNAAN